MVRYVATILFSALAVLWPATGAAHHVVSQYGIAPAEPVTRASLQLEPRQFDFGDEGPSGTAFIATPRIQYAPTSWLSGIVRLPVAHVNYDAQDSATGIGDLSLGLQGRLYATEHGKLILSAGLGAELPTGDPGNGLGGGHTELNPYLVASSEVVDDVVLFGSVTQQFSLEGGDSGGGTGAGHTHDHGGDTHHHGGSSGGSGVHGAVIAPHEDVETRPMLGAAYVFEPVYVSARTEAVLAWSRDSLFGPMEASAEVGWRPSSSVQMAIGVDAPFVGPDRYSWKADLSAAWTF